MLTGIGVGGGGLLVLYMTFVMNTEQYLAQGLNLMFFLVSSLMSVPVHIAKRQFDYKTVLLISVGGVLGSFAGALLTQVVKPELVRKLFGGLLVFSGVLVFFKSNNKSGG